MMKVSVIINTYNRANCLKKTLESLKSQNYQDFEVIVVNGPSGDNTSDLVRSYPVKYYEIDEINLSISRNVGLEKADGEIVAFIDDDGIPDNNWLKNLVREFENDQSIGAVGGPLLDHTGIKYQCCYNLANRFGKAREVFFNPSDYFSFPKASEYPALTGCNCSFRLKILEQIGGFDEQFSYFLEETDLCLRIVDAGYKIQFSHDVIVYHKYAPSHLRSEQRIIKNYYPSLRSIAYFLQKHAKDFYKEEVVANYLLEVKREHEKNLLRIFSDGQYTKSEYENILAHSRQAFHDGSQPLLPLYWNGHRTNSELLPYRVSVNSDQSPLRIVYITREYLNGPVGGIARLTEELAAGLSKRGHIIHVITRSNDRTSQADYENGYWIHRIADDEDTAEFDDSYDIPKNILKRATAVRREVDRIARMFHINIISAPIWDVEGLLLLDGYASRLVTTLHTTYLLSLDNHSNWTEDKAYYKRHIERIINAEKRVILKSSNIVANSDAIIKSIESAYEISLGKTCLKISHGIPDPSSSVNLKSISTKSEITLLFLGRLEHRKGIDLLLESASNFLAKHPDASLYICGDDTIKIEGEERTYREYFDERYQNYEWYRRVHYLGFLPRDEVKERLSSCDIFVAPSRFESFGLTHVEALSHGKPVVALRIAATPEIVSADVGLLADKDDPDQLSTLISRLISSSELRHKMGAAARARYEALFTIKGMLDNSEKYYRSLLPHE